MAVGAHGDVRSNCFRLYCFSRSGMMSRLLAFTFVLLLGAVSCNAADNPASFVEGQHYQKLERPQRAGEQESKTKAEVVEVFWYGCPHCYALEPKLTAWLKSKPEDVEFLRIPAVLNPSWDVHARTYYALELMGELDRLHPLVFAAIHEQNRRLSSMESMAEFLSGFSVDSKEFQDAYRSLPVDLRINRGKELLEAYRISGVPTMVVNGVYVTTATMAGGNDKLLETVTYLLTLGN
jgi:protein dithiol oxidoreductase (disulfide-forming)